MVSGYDFAVVSKGLLLQWVIWVQGAKTTWPLIDLHSQWLFCKARWANHCAVADTISLLILRATTLIEHVTLVMTIDASAKSTTIVSLHLLLTRLYYIAITVIWHSMLVAFGLWFPVMSALLCEAFSLRPTLLDFSYQFLYLFVKHLLLPITKLWKPTTGSHGL